MTEQTTSKSKRRHARGQRPADATLAGSPSAAAPKPSKKAPAQTKIGKVIVLLEGEEGVTLEQMVKATGWQPHTTRAALTGLRKKGYTIERGQRDGTSVYHITASPA